jgi:hypothetical protein
MQLRMFFYHLKCMGTKFKRSGLLVVFSLYIHCLAYAQFNTPYYRLDQAKKAVAAGDTLGGYKALEIAVKLGLSDIQGLANSKTLSFFIEGDRGYFLRKGIEDNRIAMTDPENLVLYTDDIGRFWACFDALHAPDAEDIFLREYIEKGSMGLQTFYQVRMNQNISKELARIRLLESYYQSIKTQTLKFESLKPLYIAAAKKLKSIYPDAIFPPIYFLVGSLNNAGTPDGYTGMLIGAEHFCKYPQANLEALSEYDHPMVFDYEQSVPIILHEYVHLQQKNKTEKTLLEMAIAEGAADFVTYLLLEKYTDPVVYAYGYENEDKLWKLFQAQLDSEESDEWLYNSYNPNTGIPGNMGYFIGFRICESFYHRATDKIAAVKQILEIQDFRNFLDESGYMNASFK